MLKINKSFFIIVFLFIASASYSQDKIIDSLKLVFTNTKLNDTTKMAAISDVMDNNYTENDPQYFYLNNWLGKLVSKNLKKKNNPIVHKKVIMWLGTYYSVLGIESYVKGQAPKSVAYLDKSIAAFKSVKAYDDMHYQMITKATFLSETNRYEEAISCLFTTLRYFEKDKNKNNGEIAYVYTIFGNMYADQKLNEKAIGYFKKAIESYERDKNTVQNVKDHLISSIYMNIATSYAALKKNGQCLEYANKALALAQKSGDVFTAKIALCRIGITKIEEGKYDEAEKLLKESVSGVTDVRTTAYGSAALGKLYYIKKDYKKADFYGEKSFQLARKNNFLDLQEQSSALLFNTNQDLKNFEKALAMHQFHDKLIDSTKFQVSKSALEKQQLKYDFEKKELNLKLDAEKKTAAKNNWLIGLSGVLLLVLLGLYFYYRNNKQKQAIAGLEKNQIKQKLLITQMNPHFIFNSIDNIQGLIYDKKDSEAVNYLGKFSKLTRQILENSNENYISLAEEVEMTENYLSIQQLLYSDKFGFKIDVEPGIDTENILLPPMLTQPFIENAIKHGINTTENGMIDIRFYLKEGKLFFEVSDNGKGFDASKRTDNHKSLAMTITRERLVNYTKNHDFVVQADNIKDRNENIVGAKVSFEIPYIYEN